MSFILSVSVFILCTGALLADQSLEKVELIAFTFVEPLEEDLYLKVYEFHYIMFPKLAPQEDTWYHEKQMSFMEEVLNGRTESYRPSLSEDFTKGDNQAQIKQWQKLPHGVGGQTRKDLFQSKKRQWIH